MKNNKYIGTGVALITPFTNGGSVDHDALANIVNHNIEYGVEYLVISGTTGESATITKTEKQDIVKTISKTNNGRVPLVLGIGGNNTATVIDDIKNTNLSDIDAILSASPAYSKPTQEGIYQHFKAIAQACPVDIILYNVPGRTAINMLPKTVLRLARDFDNIVAVKEAAGDMGQYLQLLKDKPKDFKIISGDDDLALPVALAGGSGVISVIGQAYPKAFSEMMRLGLQGKNQEAFAIHFQLMEIIQLIFTENNPGGIKTLLSALGLCDNNLRLPLVPVSEGLQGKIKHFAKTFKS